MCQGRYKNILCLRTSSCVNKEIGNGIKHVAKLVQLTSNLFY